MVSPRLLTTGPGSHSDEVARPLCKHVSAIRPALKRASSVMRILGGSSHWGRPEERKMSKTGPFAHPNLKHAHVHPCSNAIKRRKASSTELSYATTPRGSATGLATPPLSTSNQITESNKIS